MRKHLKSVPVYAPILNIPSRSADEMVAAGRAQSLRGKAILLNRIVLEEFLAEKDIDPTEAAELVEKIMRAQRAVIARKRVESAPNPTDITNPTHNNGEGVW